MAARSLVEPRRSHLQALQQRLPRAEARKPDLPSGRRERVGHFLLQHQALQDKEVVRQALIPPVPEPRLQLGLRGPLQDRREQPEAPRLQIPVRQPTPIHKVDCAYQHRTAGCAVE